MGFSDQQKLTSNYKIILVEIDLPVLREYFVNTEAGIWTTRINWDSVTIIGSDGLVGYYTNEIATINNIASLLVDDEAYTAVESMADLRTQNKSFLFEFGCQKVHIHFDTWHLPLDRIIRLGAVAGFCDKAQIDSAGRVIGSYYGGIYYRPCISKEGVPSFKKSKDPLFFGLLAYEGGNITFINDDGYFDGFAEGDVFGQPCRIKVGFNSLDYDDFRQVFSGFIEELSRDREEFSLSVKDPRKFLTRKLPTNVFSVDDYPDMDPDNENVRKPLAWGSVKNAPCYCLNDKAGAPASYSFMFLDTEFWEAHELTTVRVEGEVKVPATVNLAAGTFTLALANYDPGDDVMADFIGYEDAGGDPIENGIDVIIDIMLNYGSISYIATNYNIGEMNFEKTLAPDVGLWIGDGEEMEIKEAIEKICFAANGIFLNQDNGKWTFRSFRDDRPVNRIIYSDEWIDEPKVKYPSSQFLSSCVVKYNQDIDEDKYLQHRNNDYESEVSDRYKQYKEREFETIISNEADAISLSETIMILSRQIWENIGRKTKWQNIDLEIMDFIVSEHSRVKDSEKKWSIYEVTGINKLLSSGDVDLDLRYIADYAVEERLYVQGDLWFEFIFNDRIYADTRYEVA